MFSFLILFLVDDNKIYVLDDAGSWKAAALKVEGTGK